MSQDVAIIDHSKRDHSPWGASGASRWMSCAASVYMLETSPKPPNSAAAMQGTQAHELLEKCLRGEHIDPSEYEDESMRVGVREAVDWVHDILETYPDAQLFVEKRFKVTEEVWGSCDVLIYVPSTATLYVFDFKYGKGRVEVRGNKQLRIYGLGAIKELFSEDYKVEHVFLTICQPRYDHEDGTTRSEEADIIELFDFQLAVEQAVEQSKQTWELLEKVSNDGGGLESPFWSSGEWRKHFNPSAGACQWCVSATCPAVQLNALEHLPEVQGLEDLDTWEGPDVNTLDIERLVIIEKAKKNIEKWLKAVHSRLIQVGLAGADLGDMKIVLTQPRRAFLPDTDAVLNGLDKITGGLIDKKEFTVTKLKGLGDTEEILMGLPEEVLTSRYGRTKKARLQGIKADMAEFMEKREGKSYAIVPLTDKRDAINVGVTGFIDYTEIEDFEEPE